MSFFRIAATTRGWQFMADQEGAFTATNARVIGKYWGALLGGGCYDGFDVLGQPANEFRMRYASAHETYALTGSVVTTPSVTQQYAYFAPTTWRHKQQFEAMAAAVTFSPAWGAKVNMGTGFDVQ
jgi:hypothetical protein